MYPLRESENISYEELLKYDGGTKGYACGKWEMEQIGLQACRTYRKVMIVRPFNVVGDKQVSNYGMVVPSFIEQAMKSDLITIFGDGSQVRSFSCIETFSECFFKLLLQKEAWEYGNNIFNIGTQTGTSINDLALTVLKETNSKSLIKHVLYNEVFPNHTDVLYRVPDTRHGENYFGKVQWPSIQQIVCSIINNKIMLRT